MLYYFEEIDLFQQNDMAMAFQYLSDQRKEKVKKFRYFKDKRLSVLAYLLLKYGLKQEYGWTFNPQLDIGTFGKPYISGCGAVNFNLSHCNQGVVCAIDKETVGVDITEIKKENLMVEGAMSPGEKNEIQNAIEPDKQVTIYWSLKESYLKYLGLGIDTYLSKLDFSICNQDMFLFRGKLFQVWENEKSVITLCSNKKMEIRKVNKDEILSGLEQEENNG